MKQFAAIFAILVIVQGFLPALCHDMEEEKRQVGEIAIPLLVAALPTLIKLIGDTGIFQKAFGAAFTFIKTLVSSTNGNMMIPNTKLQIHYHIDACKLHFTGKRFLVRKDCKATVSQAETHTSVSCTKGEAKDALDCALKAEVQKLIKLGKSG